MTAAISSVPYTRKFRHALLAATAIVIASSGTALAQKQLPKCPESRKVMWTNCQGTMKYSDGTYTGSWLNDQWHGNGTLDLNDGTKYKGGFVNHKYEGKGSLIKSNGTTYDGSFKNGQYNGFGVYADKNASYEGNFANDTFHGRGIMKWLDGSNYEGDFIAGKRSGQGAYISADGKKFVGQFKDGGVNGNAEFSDGIGNKYVGNFKNSKFEGKGTATLVDGTVYTGDFKENNRHGSGTITYASGAKYIGQWKDGLRHGKGVFILNSERYEGDWENDTQNGKGIGVSSGFRYSGDYKNGMKHGFGERTLPDGSRFIGEFFENKYHGKGKLLNAAGVVIQEGEWKNDEFVSSKSVQVAQSVALQDVKATPSAIEFQINILSSVQAAQASALKSAATAEKPSIEETLKIVDEKLEALKKELVSKPALNTGYLTSVRPDNANTYLTARRASELYPKIPYYIPGTKETGEFWIEPIVSDKGDMTFALKFVDIGSTAVEKVRGQIDMSLVEIEDAQKALFKLHDWSKTAREQKIRTNFEKRVTCFPAKECPADGERLEGKASTEIRFAVYEDGSTAGRIQKNKGRFVEAYNVSIDSALLLQAYLSHVLKEAKLEFQSGTQDKKTLQELFK